MPVKCVRCQSPNKYPYQYYCSDECRQYSGHTCPICGKAVDPNRKMCSRVCNGRSRKDGKPRYVRKADGNGNYWCNGCLQFLPRDDFYQCAKNTQSGIHSRCKVCLEKQRAQWHSKPESHLLELWRHASKRPKGPFLLEADWPQRQYELQAGLCYYTGIPMTFHHGKGRVWSNASIDRIDSSQGYAPENCVLCCIGFNLMKTNLDLADLETLMRAFIAKRDAIP